MKKIIVFIMFLALLSWGAKSAFESAEKQLDSIATAAGQSDQSDDAAALYNMLPSGEQNPQDIAPAAGDQPR